MSGQPHPLRERNHAVDCYLRKTPVQLLEETGTELSWFDIDVAEDGERLVAGPEVVLSAALHTIAKILLADDFESMRLAADEGRKELIREFIR